MDKPLTTWYCDVCDEKIEEIKQGYVIWKTGGNKKSRDFKIIHQKKCNLKEYSASAALNDFVGEKGLTTLLSMLSSGPIKKALGRGSHCQIEDTDEFTDFTRRVQTPFYEEARRHFNDQNLIEDFNDSNEVSPYFPNQLEKIIKNYE